MPAAARQGDPVGPGVILGPCASTVFINGQKASLFGDSISPHGTAPHAAATINTGSSTVFIEGKRAVRVGDTATCGHAVTSGSPNVNIG